MEQLKIHVEHLPQLSDFGATYVVVAVWGEWRDGLVTDYEFEIPRLKRELRKRFMNRLNVETALLDEPPRQVVGG